MFKGLGSDSWPCLAPHSTVYVGQCCRMRSSVWGPVPGDVCTSVTPMCFMLLSYICVVLKILTPGQKQ